MRISDWSSDVCSSDLHKAAQEDEPARLAHQFDERVHRLTHSPRADELGRKVERHRMAGVERAELMRSGKERDIDERKRHCAMDVKNGRAPCRERVCQYV